MLSKTRKPNEGFTIIEVLIVLAIAGLILLIVFLAVPALQRNARNTSRKTDVSALLAAFSEFTDNNNGTLPTDVDVAGGTASLCQPAAQNTSCAGSASAIATAKLGYYTASSANTTTAGAVTLVAGATNPATVVDEVIVETGAICNGNVATGTGASTRSIVALYGIETPGSANGYSWQCVGS